MTVEQYYGSTVTAGDDITPQQRLVHGGSIRKGLAKEIDFDDCLFSAETEAARFQNTNSQLESMGNEDPLDLTPQMY